MLATKIQRTALLPPLLAGVFAAVFTVSAAADNEAGQQAPDPRRAYREGHSPAWLRAVGRLVVPGIRYENGRRRHHTERCSATLVSSGGAAETIVTAWHCLEYYEDLSQRIVFQLATNAGDTVEIEATRLADGGGMDADWAILRLQRPVAGAQAPALAPLTSAADPALDLVMAGFSRDEGIGQRGGQLSYDPACRITDRQATYMDSDCRAYKGASGGAVIQLSASGVPQLAGVISQGDGAGLSRFIPVAAFRASLRAQL
ncbi:trypsin-like serine peptidase [Parahaliea mediterranea]|uniref:Trypsin-like peptidase domain-containing protein n=1 Tax=Parahaliea mediterranea TaxID=651086 RepID=A0A939DEB2_9GAMM|nr:serine protease [Parahaliea mediterranea]MBN7796316.1 trypsin-like peptidase domain-containing protein [Parahaliea mediterranea]